MAGSSTYFTSLLLILFFGAIAAERISAPIIPISSSRFTLNNKNSSFILNQAVPNQLLNFGTFQMRPTGHLAKHLALSAEKTINEHSKHQVEGQVEKVEAPDKTAQVTTSVPESSTLSTLSKKATGETGIILPNG